MLLPTRLQMHGTQYIYINVNRDQTLICQHNQQSRAIKTINKRTKVNIETKKKISYQLVQRLTRIRFHNNQKHRGSNRKTAMMRKTKERNKEIKKNKTDKWVEWRAWKRKKSSPFCRENNGARKRKKRRERLRKFRATRRKMIKKIEARAKRGRGWWDWEFEGSAVQIDSTLILKINYFNFSFI